MKSSNLNFIAKRTQKNSSRKPTQHHIEDVMEQLGILRRNLGKQAKLNKMYQCPEKLVLPVMAEITFLHFKGIIQLKSLK